MRAESSIPFVGLHAHSGFSEFDGLGFPQEHMDFAYENGNDAHALTDHGHMNGFSYQVQHIKKMKKENKDFKAIFGVEAYFIPSVKEWKEKSEELKGQKLEKSELSKKRRKINRTRHLVLLAQNQKGLNNIFKLVSESHTGDNYYRKPRMDYEMLEKYSEGVIATSACLGGIYAVDYWNHKDEGDEAVLDAMRETTRKMLSIYGKKWYAEVQWNNVKDQHVLNQKVIKIAEEFGIELVSTVDSHYPAPHLWKDREMYKRLGWLNKPKKPEWITDTLPDSVEAMGMELYPKNGDEVYASYKKYSAEAGFKYDDETILNSISRTHHIAMDLIEDFQPDNTVRLPEFVVPEGKTDIQALTKFCLDGLKSRGLDKKQEYVDRLKEELIVIRDRGFAKYFLTMKAISDKAMSFQLTGAGRGSAAGALTSYLINITQIDPLKYDLLFERFMRKDQKDYPDIDYDVSDPMELKEALIEEWGTDTVVPITNFNTLQLRSLIKDISKFYDIPFTEVNKVTGAMLAEATPLAKQKAGIKAGVYSVSFDELMEFSESLQKFLDKYPQVKSHIDGIHGQVRSLSRHAGGVVVGEDIDKWMPLINSKGVLQTPWSEGQNVRHLEPLGFIKFDILGLASLRMMENAIRNILRRHHNNPNPSFDDVREYYKNKLHPDVIDLNDQAVYKNVFHKGKWAGIFQFTENGAQDFCQMAKPTNIIEVSAITSIYRPGPLSAKVHDQYVAAKENPTKVKYLHPLVKEVTEETYGFLIFQEQIALLAHRLGKNVSLDEGNLLRKLLTKKGTGKGLAEKENIRIKFVEGCKEKGISEVDAENLWGTFEYFSGYGFNKSHAVSYSILSYQCAWLLNYYPAEWVAAFLDKEPETRKEKAINIARSLGFKVQKVDINMSDRDWTIAPDGETLVQPLSSIKGLGDAAIDQILMHRPFNTAEELLFNEECSYSKLNKKSLDALCLSQALNTLIDERFNGLKHFWASICVNRPKTEKKLKENIEMFQSEMDFTEQEKIEYLVDLTGRFPFDKVMTHDIAYDLDRNEVPPIGEYDPSVPVVWFVPRAIKKKRTRKGKEFWILDVVDPVAGTTQIKIWGVQEWDNIHLNRPYMSRVEYSPRWGFSLRGVKRNMKILG